MSPPPPHPPSQGHQVWGARCQRPAGAPARVWTPLAIHHAVSKRLLWSRRRHAPCTMRCSDRRANPLPTMPATCAAPAVGGDNMYPGCLPAGGQRRPDGAGANPRHTDGCAALPAGQAPAQPMICINMVMHPLPAPAHGGAHACTRGCKCRAKACMRSSPRPRMRPKGHALLQLWTPCVRNAPAARERRLSCLL